MKIKKMLLNQVWEKAEGEVVIWDWVQVDYLGSARNLSFFGPGGSRAVRDSSTAWFGTG